MLINLTSNLDELTKCLPLECLDAQVCAFLSKPENQQIPWAVACSGGADSACLLLLLVAHFPQQREKLHVLHVNHGLRGLAADGDEHFVATLAENLGLPFYSYQQTDAGNNKSEAALRDVRQNFFKKILAQLNTSLLFTAHHKNDVAETLLMRLVRGSGSSSLAGPRPIQYLADGRIYLRPLLTLKKECILKALHQCKLSFRYDETNASGDYFRNRIRSSVIPALQSASPNDPLEGLALSRSLLEEDDEALNAVLDTLVSPPQEGKPWDVQRLAHQPAALWRRALQCWLRAHDKTHALSRKAFELLLAACQANYDHFSLSAGENTLILLKDSYLQFQYAAVEEPVDFNIPITLGTPIYLPDGSFLEAYWVNLDQAERATILEGRVDNAKTVYLNIDPSVSLHARSWLPGDAYRPLGAPGTQKLQDLFTNKKIPSKWRKLLPVICANQSELLWCPGLPPAETYKLLEGTQAALRLTYTQVLQKL